MREEGKEKAENKDSNPENISSAYYRNYAIKREQFPRVLAECNGFITTAAERLGISRNVYYDWRKKHPGFAETCDEIILNQEAKMLDLAESNLYRGLENADNACTFFFLKTRYRKKYGTVMTTELTGVDGESIKTESKIEVDVRTIEDQFDEIMEKIGGTD